MKDRLTPEDIQATVVAQHYVVVPGTTTTLCTLILRNGFTVTGRSACVVPANFDLAIGEKLAYADAIRQVWPLEGYLLTQARYEATDSRARMERIARACHEVNRAYCQALGDDSQPAWEDAPDWQRLSARMGADLHLMGDFGPEASHISWMNQKLAEGWKYGPVKDPEKKEHPCLVPFADLPREQQAKDYIFRAVVHALRG